MKPRVLLSWSSGKDSAWALYMLRQSGACDVVALATTFNESVDRVAMHAVRRELVEEQAEAAKLPLWTVPLPWPCTNEEYERRWRTMIERAKGGGITHVAFGDLFLADVRAYREQQLAGTGLTPLFPLWTTDDATPELAHTMLTAGVEAILTCVDPQQLDPAFVGRSYDACLLNELPSCVDPCGERGEFHTFCHAGPMFAAAIPCMVGEKVARDGFHFADVLVSRER